MTIRLRCTELKNGFRIPTTLDINDVTRRGGGGGGGVGGGGGGVYNETSQCRK